MRLLDQLMDLPQRLGGRANARYAAFGLSFLFLVTPAGAEEMDFALERLAENAETCRTEEGLSIAGQQCEPDEEAFTRLINQYGMAFSPSMLAPASTTGYGGFEVSVQGTYTTISGKSDYMRRGTRGAVDAGLGTASFENDQPPSVLQLYSLGVRKGFGFGFETGLAFGFMPKTSMIAGGLDVRLSLFEGFRDGIPGFIPDFAVTGSVRTITGTPQAQLTIAGVGATLSKPITVADTGVLTPILGYQHLFIFGDSGIIDFTPAESALQGCDYQGPDVPGTPGASDLDGSPVCTGDNSDFNNNAVFDPVRIRRQRLLFGLQYRYEILIVGAQVMADVFDSAVGLNPEEKEVFQEEKDEGGNVGNFAFALQLGARF